ncbi:hypothetical protein PV08_10558 [Exophiala spinifera]|uniref:Uncharacterized protein n=1 Tax=Exophiala spinifera TaxID=91928 RepID=A0A0D2AX21_9EURO|nr:uncharacterized protein PV08_10558 [Exophiala spinifera]KIW11258.1 hypothetical protein PV08_10558 [Exophiala spinifera]
MTQNGVSQGQPRRSVEVSRASQDVQDDYAHARIDEKTETVKPETYASSKVDPEASRGSLEDVVVEKDERTLSSSSPCLATVAINTNPANDTFMVSNSPLKFIQQKSRLTGRQSFISVSQNELRNSLLPLIGYLELANAGDFAANVFNTIPVPTFAAALMGVGGCVALCFSVVAIWDARLSARNIKVLKRERRALLSLRRLIQRILTTQLAPSSSQHPSSASNNDDDDDEKSSPRPSIPSDNLAVSVYLDVNTFETRTELVDRLLMDVTMGFGALLVGVGTLMAIGGANPRVFRASNLLSGYIGNGPAALYGLLRTIWSTYVYIRTTRHQRAVRRKVTVTLTPEVGTALDQRYAWVKLYAFLSGPTSLVAGAASLVTATRWWGYTMLAPCIVLSWVCNTMYRTRIGYTRPILAIPALGDEEGAPSCYRRTRQSDAAVDGLGLSKMNEQMLSNELNEVVTMRKSFEFAKKHAKAASKKNTGNRTTGTRTSTSTIPAEGNATRTAVSAAVPSVAASPSSELTFKILTKLNLVEPLFLGHVNNLLSMSPVSPSSGSSSPGTGDEERRARTALVGFLGAAASSSVDSTLITESRISPSPSPLQPRSPPFLEREPEPGTTLNSRSATATATVKTKANNLSNNNNNSSSSSSSSSGSSGSSGSNDGDHKEDENIITPPGGTSTSTDLDTGTITIHDPHSLLASTLLFQGSQWPQNPRDQHHHQTQEFLNLANSTITTHGLVFAKYRERYTIEFLGSLLHRQ